MSETLKICQVGRTKRLVAQTSYERRELMAALPGAVWDRTSRLWTYPATMGCAVAVHRALTRDGSRDLTVASEVEGLLVWARSAVVARANREEDDLPNPPSRVYEAGDLLHPPRYDIEWLCLGCDRGFTARDVLPRCPHCDHPHAMMSATLAQRRAYWWALQQEAAALDMGMGAGKSKVAVDLCNAWDANKVLVLAPKAMIGGWRRQFEAHSRNRFWVSRGEVYGRSGRLKRTARPSERIEALEALFSMTKRVVVTINYELAWREPFRSWLLGQHWDVVALDEGHRARAPGGKQGLFAAALRDTALGVDGGRRLELTGTIMPHSPLDLYGQGRFLDPCYFGTSYRLFKNKYGRPRVKYFETDVDADGEVVKRPVYLTTPGGEVIVDGVRDEVKDELSDKLGRFSFYVSPEEANDLPAPDEDVIPVTLSAKTSKAYRELDQDLMADIEGGICTVDNALVRFLRLAQITSGHLPVEIPCPWCRKSIDDVVTVGLGGDCSHCAGTGVAERIETIGTEKRDALAELLGDLPTHRIDPRTLQPVRSEPVVAWARFLPDLIAIQQATEKAGRGPYRELSGAQTTALTEDSTLMPDTGVAGVQMESGSEGVDFTLCRLVVYYSQTFSLRLADQSHYRHRRPGADLDHPVLYRHLIAELDDGTPTIDAQAYEAVQERREVVEYVHSRMRERAGSGVAA